MPKPVQRTLHVAHKTWISPHLVRVTFAGEDLREFPEGRESANCKLLIPDGSGSSVVRTYTVRSYRSSTREVDIDFFIHEEPGPASNWARKAAKGDEIGFKGPSSPKLVNPDGDWLLLAGDMSAMPAMEANLERLPSHAKGIVVFEVVSEDDIRPVSAPAGMQIHWVINAHPAVENSVLFDAVTALDLPQGIGAVWIAGESHCIRQLRRYFKDDVGIARTHFYGSGYWQIGLTEDAHQQVKRQEQADQ